MPHTSVDAIINIDVREFQKQNKKIVWLMGFCVDCPVSCPPSPPPILHTNFPQYFIFCMQTEQQYFTCASEKYVATASRFAFILSSIHSFSVHRFWQIKHRHSLCVCASVSSTIYIISCIKRDKYIVDC